MADRFVREHLHLSLTPRERREYGVTATLVDTATGETRVEVVRGQLSAREATRGVAAICDELGETWKVRTLSTPMTILADLMNAGGERLNFSESAMLGGIRRTDLIERPQLYAGLKTSATFDRRRNGKTNREARAP